MGYCRYCGTEIAYKRTKNEKWLPCNALTGEPHFCQKEGGEKKQDTGISPCPRCGKPLFAQKKGRRKILIDYATLCEHQCKAGDMTRYAKYKAKKEKSKC